MLIESEQTSYFALIRALLQTTFPTAAEAALVESLRAAGDAEIALIARHADAVVGYIMLSRMASPAKALGLGPLAVAPAVQGKGIATRLVNEALLRARAHGWETVFMLGDPAFYARFGFSTEAAAGYESRYAGPYLQAVGLKHHGLTVGKGRLEYDPAFAALE